MQTSNNNLVMKNYMKKWVNPFAKKGVNPFEKKENPKMEKKEMNVKKEVMKAMSKKLGKKC